MVNNGESMENIWYIWVNYSIYGCVTENVVYPIVPNGFADHYPVFKWLFHWEYTLHFQTNPNHFTKKRVESKSIS